MTNSLTKLDRATQMLAEIRSVDDAKKVVDLAEAARIYAKQVDLGLEAQNHAAEIKIRAQRRAGEILEQMEKRGERQTRGGDKKSKSQPVTLKLQDLGISKNDASRWQSIAAIPVEEFEQHVSETLASSKELTTAGMVRLTQSARRDERIEEILNDNRPLETGTRYPIIYADPPWRYENPPMGGSNRSIENHYPTMALDEICALPVKELAGDDALIYLWATAPKLAECLQVMTAWGFEYRTNFVWVKDKIGMGYHARSQHELLLIGKRGEIPPPSVDVRVSSVVYAPRTEHSAKPIEFYELIESFYPELPKIELFCRNPRKGWAAWGNQS